MVLGPVVGQSGHRLFWGGRPQWIGLLPLGRNPGRMAAVPIDDFTPTSPAAVQTTDRATAAARPVQ